MLKNLRTASLAVLILAAGPFPSLDSEARAGGPGMSGSMLVAAVAWFVTGRALDRGMPVLGICRGMQVLNVALGGTLVQHLDGHAAAPGVFSAHTVKPVPGTRYAEIVPDPATDVPTYHHQAVDRLGAGLIPSAHADDGTVEAIELPAPGWVLGVQWHPEAGVDVRVMRSFVGAAGSGA